MTNQKNDHSNEPATGNERQAHNARGGIQGAPSPSSKRDPRLYEEVGLEEVIGDYVLGNEILDDDIHGDGGNVPPFDPNDRIALNERIALDEKAGPVYHRDLSDIEVTDIDGITINRTKRGISPFVPIIKTPTFSENVGNHTGFAVEIEDPDAETGFRHVGNVSYLLLPNEDVRALAAEIAMRSEMPFKESRIFWDGSRICHVIDFLETEEIDDGDEVGLGLVTRSSYDKSWRYECALMGKRFVCDNGALSGEFFARVSFKHTKGSVDQAESWKEIVRQGLSVIDGAPDNLHRFAECLRALKRAEMTDARLREVWRLFPTIGDSIKGQIVSRIVSRYVEHEEPTLFGLFNAGTNVFWHWEKMTAADYAHNDAFTTALLSHALWAEQGHTANDVPTWC